MSSNLSWDEFSLMGKKISLAVLAARLGPHGHGPGFRGFLYPVKPVRLPLNEKNGRAVSHPPGRVLDRAMLLVLPTLLTARALWI